MPELPEVETLRRGLERTVLGRRIVDVTVANAKVLKGQSEAVLRERTVDRYITQIQRRGKYLLVTLSDKADVPSPGTDAIPSSPFLLCIHLKMRGHIQVEEETAEPGPYLCVSLILEDNTGRRTIMRYYDIWTWGEIRAFRPDELAREVPALKKMGEEPLDPKWGAAILGKKLKSRRTAIKPTLLDQAVVAGVGNIYADESLFRAGIHPERIACTLSEEETERLTAAIRSVLGEAVAGGGTTSDNYFDVAGKPGKFQPLVYDRGGQPCPKCATPLSRIRLGGRGTVFCETCQPASNATATTKN